jgi:hypothetical protein
MQAESKGTTTANDAEMQITAAPELSQTYPQMLGETHVVGASAGCVDRAASSPFVHPREKIPP